jgi:DNA modification methylase
MEPYYEDADVLIYHADLREVPDLGTVACVVTSPPYNSGVAYDVHDDAMADEDYRELATAAAGLMAFTLGPERGRAWVNVGVTQLHVWLDALREAGFDRSTTVAWADPNRSPGGGAGRQGRKQFGSAHKTTSVLLPRVSTRS